MILSVLICGCKEKLILPNRKADESQRRKTTGTKFWKEYVSQLPLKNRNSFFHTQIEFWEYEKVFFEGRLGSLKEGDEAAFFI